MKASLIFFASVSLVLLASFSVRKKQKEEIKDFSRYYKKNNVDGCMVIFDQNENTWTYYNKGQVTERFTPASTFKIPNTLIGLETGAIPDENFIMKWDGTKRANAEWNRDHDLRSAFKYSVVWYYQELALKVGSKNMVHWLKKCDYGNQDTTGGLNKFWLTGGLRISPVEQIHFLRKLHDLDLPFSKRSMNITKNIMFAMDSKDAKVYAKTGWGGEDKRDIGWYVGYIEKNGNVYYFANCIQTDNLKHPDFARARAEIAYDIFDEMGIIKK